MKPLICIDARLWGIKHTGPGRYTQNLLDHLPTDDSVKIAVIVSPENASHPSLSRFQVLTARHHPYSLASQFEMAGLLWRLRPQLFHATHFTIPVFWPGKIVVTIHDLIKHYSRGQATTTRHPLLYWLKYAGYVLMVRLAVARAAHIMVPSAYWKQILQSKYHLFPDKITVTYEAVAADFLATRPTPYTPPVKAPFLVHTGNLYPHKNISTLVAAVNRLQGQVRLLLVCSRSAFSDRIPISPYVAFAGRLSDSQLISLYKQAAAYIFPSYIEGFGLPGLEAMAVGLPVIASNSSCLPEIYQDAALYFSPDNVDELVSKIQQLLSQHSLQKTLIAKGKQQVKKYSWAKMSAQTWQIYRAQLP